MKRFLVIWLLLVTSSNIPAAERFTARELYYKADSLAKDRISVSKLAGIISTEVDTAGKSEYWEFQFDYLDVYISADSIHVTPFNLYQYTGWNTIDAGWLDSDSIITITEFHGGKEFRKEHPDTKISVWYYGDSAAPFTMLEIKYISSDPEIYYWFYIHALTGQILGQSVIHDSETDFDFDFSLQQNYPNPFNNNTSIPFSLSKSGNVSIEIYNVTGQLVAALIDEFREAGHYEIKWNAADFPSGVYFCKLSLANKFILRKLILQK